MSDKETNKDLPAGQEANKEQASLRGYPLYPENEDIYNKFREEKDIDPEDVSGIKEQVEPDEAGANNEKGFKDDLSGGDLDIPGSELDDRQELTGNEDEENNYYSLGGDGHTGLDENR